MTLIDAPAYDERRESRNQNLLIAAGVAFVLCVILFFAGFLLGHGWFFSNLPYEHRMNTFFNALEARDYAKAYDIYVNDKTGFFRKRNPWAYGSVSCQPGVTRLGTPTVRGPPYLHPRMRGSTATF